MTTLQELYNESEKQGNEILNKLRELIRIIATDSSKLCKVYIEEMDSVRSSYEGPSHNSKRRRLTDLIISKTEDDCHTERIPTITNFLLDSLFEIVELLDNKDKNDDNMINIHRDIRVYFHIDPFPDIHVITLFITIAHVILERYIQASKTKTIKLL